MPVSIPVPFLAFQPPLIGFQGEFNTIRLGRKWATKLTLGQLVLLADEKDGVIFGMATVRYVEVSDLLTICKRYGWENHTQAGTVGKRRAGENVLKVIRKLYGPHIATDTKLATAIGLTLMS